MHGTADYRGSQRLAGPVHWRADEHSKALYRLPRAIGITAKPSRRLRVKMRNPRCEQMCSALLPTHEVAALQPAAREQEPRGR
jgi:hypothetical protein